jgi:hypothetical protein
MPPIRVAVARYQMSLDSILLKFSRGNLPQTAFNISYYCTGLILPMLPQVHMIGVNVL